MKYLAVLTLGILTGLALSRLPHYPLFNDAPQTPEGWEPKVRGNWSEGDRATLNRYYNGGK